MISDLTPPKQAKRHAPLLLLIALALAVLAVLSFTVYSPEETGELYAACLSLGNALSENDAVAVFLGMTTPSEEEKRIEEAARDYIEKHNEDKSD